MARTKKEEVAETTEVIMLGDKAYDKDNLTPSAYFDYVKGLKQKLNYEEQNIIIDGALKMLKKTKITGQTEMAKELTHQVELALRELDAAHDGFDIFVNRKDIEKYIDDVEGKSIKIMELDKYERDIPDEVVDKLEIAKKHFDQVYIIFTDYTKKETKKVAKERRDKDPIMFGAFHDKDGDEKTSVYVEDRMFFIADWVEENCDLTLEEMVRDVKNKTGEDITYRISVPADEEAVKEILKTLNTEPVQIERVSLFDKIKEKVTRKKKSTTTTEKKEEKKKSTRGRKKKSEE